MWFTGRCHCKSEIQTGTRVEGRSPKLAIGAVARGDLKAVLHRLRLVMDRGRMGEFSIWPGTDRVNV